MKCVQVSLRETFPSSNITFPMFSICNLKHLSNKSWILFLLGCCKKIISDIFSEISMEQLFTAAILRKQFLMYFYFGIPKMFLTPRRRGRRRDEHSESHKTCRNNNNLQHLMLVCWRGIISFYRKNSSHFSRVKLIREGFFNSFTANAAAADSSSLLHSWKSL